MHEANPARHEGRVSALRERHRVLEERIRSLSNSPAADPLEITDLKKAKLRIKEEIELAA